MLHNKNKQQKSPQKRFLFILGVIMFGFYLILGLFIIFWDDIPLTLDKGYRVLFGVILIIYSFFRFIRLLQAREQ